MKNFDLKNSQGLKKKVIAILMVLSLIVQYFVVPIVYATEENTVKMVTAVRSNKAIDENGNLWSWGDNTYGQLGDGTNVNSYNPKIIMKGTKFVQIAGTGSFAHAIDIEGNLYSWGNNASGSLGNGTNVNSNKPVKIMEGTKFKQVSMCSAIDIDGNLWRWGANNSGEIGNGTTVSSNRPIKIMEGTKFEQVYSSSDHALAIDSEGNLWTWGKNSSYELGTGKWSNYSDIPNKVMEGTKFKKAGYVGKYGTALGAIDIEGNLWLCGEVRYWRFKYNYSYKEY